MADTDTLEAADRELEAIRHNRLTRFSKVRDKHGCWFNATALVTLVDGEADYHKAEAMARAGVPLWLIYEELT